MFSKRRSLGLIPIFAFALLACAACKKTDNANPPDSRNTVTESPQQAATDEIPLEKKFSTSECRLTARQVFDEGNTAQAEKMVEEMLAQNPQNAEAMLLAGDILKRKGIIGDALEKYSQASEIFRKEGDDDNLAAALIDIGEAYSFLDRHDRATDSFNRAVEICSQTGNEIICARARNRLTSMPDPKAPPEDPLDILNKNLKTAIEKNDKRLEAETLAGMGEIFRLRGRLEESLEHLNKSLEICRQIGYKSLEVLDLNNIAGIYKAQNKLDEALSSSKQALEMATAMDAPRLQAMALNNMGITARAMQRYDDALQYYLKGIEISRKISDMRNVAGMTHNAGIVLNAQGKYKEALEYLNQSLEISRKIGDARAAGLTLIVTGITQKNMGNYLEAKWAWQEAISHMEAVGDKKAVADIEKMLDELPKHD